MGWFIAFFAGLFSLIMAEDYLPALPENIIVAVITSLIGGYVAANTVRRGDALMSGRQMHLIAVSWFLPISALSILFTISEGEILIPVAWGIGASVGVFVMLILFQHPDQDIY